MAVSSARKRARTLFGGGLIFFIVGIVLHHVPVIAFAIVLLVGALVYHSRASRSSDESDRAG